MGEFYLVKSNPIEWPEESLWDKPHLVKDEVGKRAKGEDKKPGFILSAVEVESGKGNEDEK